MNLWFVRHGESEATVQRDSAPAGHDLPLTEHGHKEAENVAEYFRSQRIPLTAVYASTFIRAVQTAEPTAKAYGFEIQKDARLCERDWGLLNSLTWPEVAARLKDMSIEERYRFVPEGGESWEQMENRVLQVIDAIRSTATGDTAIFTHGGVLRGLLPVLAGVSKEEHATYTMDTGAISVFDTERGVFDFVNLKP